MSAETHDNCCRNAVGVSDANIILDSFTREKSHYPVNALPSYDRLNGTREDGWCAELNDGEKWLQVDLEKVTKVYAVATQGDINGNEWVIYFKPAHSSLNPMKTCGQLIRVLKAWKW